MAHEARNRVAAARAAGGGAYAQALAARAQRLRAAGAKPRRAMVNDPVGHVQRAVARTLARGGR